MAKKRMKGWGPRERTDKRSGWKFWIVDYKDAAGKRHQQRFRTQKEAADAWRQIQTDLSLGRHVAPSASVTLDEAAEDYYAALIAEGGARGSIDGRRYTYENHISDRFGKMLVSKLTGPMVHRFLTDLLERGTSKNLVKNIKVTLSAILSEAVRRGTAAFNAAMSVRRARTRRAAITRKKELQCGEVIAKSVIGQLVHTAGQTGRYSMAIRHDGRVAGLNQRQRCRTINSSMEAVEIIHVEGGEQIGSEAYERSLSDLRRRWSAEENVLIRAYHIEDWTQPFVIGLAFTGLRIGEMRGVSWPDIDWGGVIHVRNAVDQYGGFGAVKSPAALRDVPMGDIAREALRQLWLRRGKPDAGLVFPGRTGTPQSRDTVIGKQFHPLWLLMNLRDSAGNLIYTSFHPLRHFCVSLWIDQNANPKEVQKWVGHENLQTTMDIYGHLFEARDAARAKVSEAERSVLGNAFKLPSELILT